MYSMKIVSKKLQTITAITLRLCVQNNVSDETVAAKTKMKRTAQKDNKHEYQFDGTEPEGNGNCERRLLN